MSGSLGSAAARTEQESLCLDKASIARNSLARKRGLSTICLADLREWSESRCIRKNITNWLATPPRKSKTEWIRELPLRFYDQTHKNTYLAWIDNALYQPAGLALKSCGHCGKDRFDGNSFLGRFRCAHRVAYRPVDAHA
ncbi:unnamed protein product [Amoebophrya sp. A25]|nr:unnamed protein product [Amoebophrya sp. A25]|eukprot:GSA25T00011767001.1